MRELMITLLQSADSLRNLHAVAEPRWWDLDQ